LTPENQELLMTARSKLNSDSYETVTETTTTSNWRTWKPSKVQSFFILLALAGGTAIIIMLGAIGL
jgi:hypothetical protein